MHFEDLIIFKSFYSMLLPDSGMISHVLYGKRSIQNQKSKIYANIRVDQEVKFISKFEMDVKLKIRPIRNY